VFASVLDSFKNRWAWLAVNLVTAFIASRVIGIFEQSIAQLVALAALMPIVAGIGGNSGNQTVTMIVRALALGQIQGSYWTKLLAKELGVALLNGVVWGTLLGAIAYLLYGRLALAAVMALAMTLNLMLAAGAGVAIPWLRARGGHDPAPGSSVLITAVTDSGGFFIPGTRYAFPCLRVAKASRAASSVRSISGAPCAPDTNPASYAEGAR
jgi:magnesium transporter